MPARPILLSLALDENTHDVVRAAAELASRAQAPLATVHALHGWPLESASHIDARIAERRERVLAHLESARDEGATVLEPVIDHGSPSELVVRTAMETNAQIIVTGGGSPPTVRRWVLGSTAERIVRTSPVPVYLARGTRPDSGMPILCPIDLSPHSRVGLHAAVRMARLFGTPLVTLTVIPVEERGWLTPERLELELAREERVANDEVQSFLAAQDLGGVQVEPRVVVGKPAERIIEASEKAWLLVIGSRHFIDLVPGAIGEVTERALRYSRCNALAVRDDDAGRDDREAQLRELGVVHQRARDALAAGRADEAIWLSRLVASQLPANAAVQELLADALDSVGNGDEAEGHRAVARVIRSSFG